MSKPYIDDSISTDALARVYASAHAASMGANMMFSTAESHARSAVDDFVAKIADLTKPAEPEE